MKKNYFTSSYTSSNSLVTTLKFISWFNNKFLNELTNKFNLFYLETPKICKFQSNLNERVINFDNKECKEVFQIIKYPCKYLNRIWNELNNYKYVVLGLITKYVIYHRDNQINNVQFIYNNVIDIRMKISEIEKSNFNELISNAYKLIKGTVCELINEYSYIDKSLKINDEFLKKDYKLKSLNNFSKISQTLKLDDYIQQKVVEYQFVLLTNIANNKSKYLDEHSKYDDEINNAQLLYLHQQSNSIINLMQFAISNENKLPYLHIQINIEQLIMIILNKEHIAEVLPGAWTNVLKKEALKKNVDIL